MKLPETFEEMWEVWGGAWSVTWPDGTTVYGHKEPPRPKLRLIQGGKADPEARDMRQPVPPAA